MEHFYVWNFSKWKRYGIVALFALVTAFVLWFQSDLALFTSSQPEETIFTRGNEDEKNISLTFNISWGEDKVHDILNQLAQHHIQSTFFVSGEWAERHPDIVKKIVENKHELGILGYRYKSYLDQEIEQVRKDLIYAKDVFTKLGYEKVDLLRTPSGQFNKEIVRLAEQVGYQVTHWSVNPNDWQNPGTEAIVDTVMKQTKNGDIVLLHASDSVKQTAKALETILPGLKNKGFQFVTMSELMNQANTKEKLIE